MYTLLERDDGSLELRTHVPAGRISPSAAARLLGRLQPVLRELRARAAEAPGAAEAIDRSTEADVVGAAG